MNELNYLTKEEKENIKNRLSNIGEKVGELALDYISNLEKEISELKTQNETMKCCYNCKSINVYYCECCENYSKWVLDVSKTKEYMHRIGMIKYDEYDEE